MLVSGSRDDLTRALTNLVDNAVRHARTAVTLRLVTSPTAVEVHVVDDGRGIPPEQRERVFDRFTRLDDARDRDSGGTGPVSYTHLDVYKRQAHRGPAAARRPGSGRLAGHRLRAGTGRAVASRR